MRTLQNLFLTAATMLCCTAATWAQTTFENEAGTLKFTVTDGNNVSVSKGTNTPSGDIEIPSEVTDSESGTPYTVTSIGSSAFLNCSDLTSVTIPESVESIGYMAFRGCTGLTSINIPKSVISIADYAFSNCSNLTTINISEGVINIQNDVFSNCSNLTTINIPESVTSIGDRVFNGCRSLQRNEYGNADYIKIGENPYLFLEKVKSTDITECEINSNCKFINTYAFSGCSGLTSVTIPENVTSICNNAFRNCTNMTKVTINSNALASKTYNTSNSNLKSIFGAQVTEFVIGEDVTAIGDYAFYKYDGITSVTFSGTSKLQTIGQQAFSQCTSLSSISIPESVTSIGHIAFYECSNLTKVTINSDAIASKTYQFGGSNLKTIFGAQVTEYVIGEDVTAIGDYAFNGCSNMTSITISDNVTSLGNNAFSSCRGLTSITIPENVESIGNGAFSSCTGLESVTIPENVKNIGNNAFRSCTGLTSVAIPENVTTIGDKAFDDCTNLTKVTINNDAIASKTYTSSSSLKNIFGAQVTEYILGEDVTAIGDYAFSGCANLTSITIPDNVTTLGGYAFQYCTGLESIIIPENVTSVGVYAFRSCTGLTSVTIPENVTTIGEQTFCGCTNLASVTFSDASKLETIGEQAFKDCSNLTSVTIPEGVTSISGSAFYGCTGLTSITIPDGVKSIGNYAFYGCTGFTSSVTIPESVENIDAGAFQSCNNVTEFIFENATPPTFGTDVFYNTTCPIYVPNAAALRDYKQANNMSSYAYRVQVRPIVVDGVLYKMQEDGTCIVLANNYTGDVFIRGSVDYNGVETTVTSISGDAFRGCSDLTSVTIPNGITSIPNNAFYECIGLTTVTIPGSVESIGNYAFYGCTGLTEVNIDNGVESIGNYTFYDCTNLTKVTINSNAIVSKTYTDNNNLKNIFGSQVTEFVLGDNVTTIGDYAFCYYTNLTTITIPSNIISIGSKAFYNCSKVKEYSFEKATPPTFGAQVFNGSSCPIYVPTAAAITDYKQANNMSSYASRIQVKAIVVDGVKYQLQEDGTCIVLANDYSGDVVIRGSIDYNGVDATVTTISGDAFKNCTDLTSVVILDGVTSIGAYAFKDCSSLETVNFNAKNCTSSINNIFSGCTSVTTITIGDNVETIPAYAFRGCSGLKTLTISASVTNIGSYAFDGCNEIETLSFDTDAIGYQFNNKATIKTLNIGNSVTNISDYAFQNCTGLTSINIPEGVTNIGSYAFKNCTGLTSINIPEGVASIGSNAFEGCTGIKSVTVPASVTTIGDDAFKDCNSIETLTYNTDAIGARFSNKPLLKTVNIGEAVTKIGNNTFSGCTGLTAITIPSNVTSIGEYAFKNCTGFTSMIVPNTVTNIDRWAFYGCSNLTKITLPFVGGKPYTAEDAEQNVFGYIFGFTPMNWNVLPSYTGSTTIQSKYIGDEVNGYYFYIPSGLREVVITGSSYIQPYAFNNCSMLTSITIPESVTSVGEQAFRYTDSDIIFEGATPPSFGEYVFENSSSYSTYPIYVPTEEAVEAYKAAENMQSDLSDYRNRVMVNPYCKVTVVANNSDYGTVSGSGTYNRTTTPTVTITAIAAENYSFVCWAEDGATEATHEITLSGAATYTAIFKRTVTISNVVAENKEYNGNAEAAISYDVDGLLNSDDVAVTPTAAFADANAGTGKVVSYSFELSGNDADNYVFAEGSQSGTVTANITPVLVSEPEIVLSATEFTYSGEAQTPTVTVKTGEIVIAAAEYEVSFSDDVTNAGEKTVTVSNIAGNYTVNGSATYTINPAAEAPNKPEATMETRCINTEFVELPENWQWTENKALALGDNTATAEYTGADAGNYLVESVDIAITRLGCEHTEGVDILNALEPTCTAEGYTGDQRCKICGEIISTGEAITAAGHKADSVVFENIVEATRTAAGSYDSVVYCSVCKVELSRTTVEVPQILAETIKLASNPNKVEYKQGEKLDVKGGKITIGYSDKSTEDFEILAGWVSGFDSQKVGEQKLTVTFESVSSTLTTTFNVTVSKEDDNTAIDEASANAVNIYAYQNVIVVENAADEIDIYNAMGALVCRDAARHVSTATGLGARTEIRMNTAGIYIVKVGNVAKRVMIND